MQTVVWIGQQCAGDEESARYLQREGCRLMRAPNGTDGLAAVRDTQPMLVLVDHQLPGPGGLQVLKEVRAARPDCEVALVTMGGEVDVAVEVLRAGAIDYLRRPLDVRELGRALSRARAREQCRCGARPPAILVLDDHHATLSRLAKVLEAEGYQVYEAADGKAGLRVLEEHAIDLVLADLRMPEMGGLSVLRETKGQGSDVEFIMMTGYGDEDAVVEALRHGAADFLSKPVDLEHLLTGIEQALEAQAQHRGARQREHAVELMRQVVLRLTTELEIIVEPPQVVMAQVRDFGRRLLDAVPLSVLVADSQRQVVFANRQAEEHFGALQDGLVATDLRKLTPSHLHHAKLEDLIRRTIDAQPGTIEQLTLGRDLLVMTPLKLLRRGSPERFVALAVCGEHPARAAPDEPEPMP